MTGRALPPDTGIDPVDVLDGSPDGFIVMDADGIVRGWNRAATRIFGWEADEAIGSRLSHLIIPERYRELHEHGLQSYLQTGVGPVLGATIEIEGTNRDGLVVPVELSITPVTSDEPPVFHAFLRDVTNRRRMERFLRASARTAWSFATGAQDIPAVIEAVGDEMAFQVGIAWVADTASGRTLVMSHTWEPTTAASTFVAGSASTAFERGIGLVGLAWESGEPQWVTDVSQDPRYARRTQADRLGLHSGLFLPLSNGGELLGVLEFLTDESRPADDQLIRCFAGLADQVAQQLRG